MWNRISVKLIILIIAQMKKASIKNIIDGITKKPKIWLNIENIECNSLHLVLVLNLIYIKNSIPKIK